MASRPLRIFVSATSVDLRSYRKAVADELHHRELTAVEQDHFSPTFRTVQQELTRKLRSCDAVICLVGIAFGEEPRQRPAHVKRQSYTQMEYRLAKKLRKRVFLFIAAEDCQFDSEVRESEDKVVWQQDYRQALRSEDNVYSEFHGDADLRQLIGRIPFGEIRPHSKIPMSVVASAAALLGAAGVGFAVYSHQGSPSGSLPLIRESRQVPSIPQRSAKPVRGKKELTREQAAGQLEAAKNDQASNKLELHHIEGMIEAGYLERAASYSLYSYSITDRGKTALAAVKPVRVEAVTGPSLVTAAKISHRIEVTGIQVQSDDSAEVEYTEHVLLPAEWPGPIKDLFRQKKTGCHAVFRLWDDGWRLEQP